MKKFIITILIIIISLGLSAQSKDTTSKPIDSVALFSIRDIDPIFEAIKKLPYEQAAPLVNYIQQLVSFRATEFKLKNEKKEKPKK